MSLVSYSTPGQSSVTYQVPVYDSFCSQRSHSAPTEPSLPALTSQLLIAILTSNHTLNVTLELVQDDIPTVVLSDVTDSTGQSYTLISPISLLAALQMPIGSLSLSPHEALTPNYELLATQAIPATSMWKEIMRSWAQLCLDEVASGSATMQILTGSQNRPYDFGVDSVNSEVLEAQSVAGSPYLSQITFTNGTQIRLTFAFFNPRPQHRWFIIWPQDIGGIVCPASARNVWGPGYAQTYHSLGTILTDPWSQFTLFNPHLELLTQVSITGFPGASVSVHLESDLEQVWLDLVDTMQNMRLVLPDVYVQHPNVSISDWMMIPYSAFYNGAGSTCNTLDVTLQDFKSQPNLCTSSIYSCLGNQLGFFINDPLHRLTSYLESVDSLYGMENSTGTELPRVRLVETNGQFSRAFFGFNGAASTTLANLALDLTTISNGLKQPSIGLPMTWSYNIVNQTTIRFSFMVRNDGQLASNFTASITCTHTDSIAPLTRVLVPTQQAEFEALLTLNDLTPSAIMTCNSTISVNKTKPLWRSDKVLPLPPITVPLQPVTGCFLNASMDSFLFVAPTSWEDALRNGETTSQDWTQPDGLLGTNPLHINASGDWLLGAGYSLFQSVPVSLKTHGTADVTIRLQMYCDEVDDRQVLVPTVDTVDVAANASVPTDILLNLAGKPVAYSVSCSLQVSIPVAECTRPIGKIFDQHFELHVPAFPCQQATNLTEPSLFLPIQQWKMVQSSPAPPPRNLMSTTIFQTWIIKPSSSNGWDGLGITLEEVTAETNPFDYLTVIVAEVSNAGNSSGNATAQASCTNILFSSALSSKMCTAQAGGRCFLRLTFIANSTAQAFEFLECTLVTTALPPADNSDACWSPYGKVYMQSLTLDRVGSSPPSSSPTTPQKAKRGIFGIGVAGSNALLAILIILAIGAMGLAIAVTLVVANKSSDRGYEMTEDPEHSPPKSFYPPPPPVIFPAPTDAHSAVKLGNDSKLPQSDGYVL
jgi:hypothetical protein